MQKISDSTPKGKKQTERRQNTRIKPAAGAFAAIASDFDRIGNIVDISRGGLAFHYVSTRESWIGAKAIDIFHKDIELFLKGIPIKPVLEMDLAKDNASSSVLVRRMNVEFVDLNQEQAQQLDHLLREYATDPVSL